MSASARFTLKLKNPCLEPSLIQIAVKPLKDVSYVLFEDTKYFGHDEF